MQDDIDDDVHGLPLLDGLTLRLRGGEVEDLDPQEEDYKVGREEEDGRVRVDKDIGRVVHLQLTKGNGGLQEERRATPYRVYMEIKRRGRYERSTGKHAGCPMWSWCTGKG